MKKTAIATELVKLAKELTAGTWSAPKTPSEMKRLEKMIRRMQNGEEPLPGRTDITTILYPLLGDDRLFDELESAKRVYLTTCAEEIKSRLKTMMDDTWKDETEHQMVTKLNKILNG